MKKIILIIIILLLVININSQEKKAEIKKIDLDIPVKFNVQYSGESKSSFKNGLPIGIGSGLFFKGKNKKGSLEFYCITDRGPNLDAPLVEYIEGKKPNPSKLFPVKDFSPSIGIIEVKGDKAQLISILPIKMNNKNITGLPIPFDKIGSTDEIALDESMKILGFDPNGMDTEGIAVDKMDGNFWVCDEYGPFIAKIDAKTGNIIKKYSPGDGLPEIIKLRQANRGMEGMAVTPNNMIYGIIQSVIDFDGKIKENKSTFIRLIELDPKSGKTKIFAYPHDVEVYSKSGDAKIGDLVALNETTFLLIEQATDKTGTMRNLIYKIDISNATDISDIKTVDGKELEAEPDRAKIEAMGIKYITKELLFDLRKNGWETEKVEGLALIDEKTIAVISDNDFGIKSKIINPAKDSEGKEVKKETKYTVTKTGEVIFNGIKTDTKFNITPNQEKSAFWIIKFDSKI